ncbi:helix-turn-helix transcriptional regulator [Streptomyces sp. NPDC048275]|uniref:helix-turn-helix domain-containing protein n=1 Tax=Streptomyces sp. NPDC048275 TaxID=3155629 RepID=UPI0033FF1474
MAGDIEAASPALCRLYLGIELRKLRKGRGLVGQQVATLTAWSPAKITRIESGSKPVEPMDVRVLCQLYEADAETASRLEGYAFVTKTKKDWWQSPQYRPVMRPGFDAFIGLEAIAAELHEYQSEFVPGLLQTEGYVRTLHATAYQRLPEDEVQRRIAMRLTRQEILTRKDRPLKLAAIVNEAVLRRVVGSPEVMERQLTHMLEVAQLPNVTLQVVPFSAGSHPCMGGPFIVLEFPDPVIKPIVYLENLVTTAVTSKEDDVEWSESAFRNLAAMSLGHDESLSMIEKVRKEY